MGHTVSIAVVLVEAVAIVPALVAVVAALLAVVLSNAIGKALGLREAEEASRPKPAEPLPEWQYWRQEEHARPPVPRPRTAARKTLFGALFGQLAAVFGLLRLSDIRNVAAGIFGLTAAIAVGLTVSDHSHKTATYILWFGIAVISLVVWVGMTLYERKKAKAVAPA